MLKGLFRSKTLKDTKESKIEVEEALPEFLQLDIEKIKFYEEKSKSLLILRQIKNFIRREAKMILSAHGNDFDKEISLIEEHSNTGNEDNIEANAIIIQEILGFFFGAVKKFENKFLEQKNEKITVFGKNNQDFQDDFEVLTIIANLLQNTSDISMMFIQACKYCSKKDIAISKRIYQYNERINIEQPSQNSILSSFNSTFTTNKENPKNYFDDACNFCAKFPEQFGNFKFNSKFFFVICAVYLHENFNENDLKVSIIENLQENFENIKKEGEINIIKTDLILDFFDVLNKFQQENKKSNEKKTEKGNNDESPIINSLMSSKKEKEKLNSGFWQKIRQRKIEINGFLETIMQNKENNNQNLELNNIDALPGINQKLEDILKDFDKMAENFKRISENFQEKTTQNKNLKEQIRKKDDEITELMKWNQINEETKYFLNNELNEKLKIIKNLETEVNETLLTRIHLMDFKTKNTELEESVKLLECQNEKLRKSIDVLLQNNLKYDNLIGNQAINDEIKINWVEKFEVLMKFMKNINEGEGKEIKKLTDFFNENSDQQEKDRIIKDQKKKLHDQNQYIAYLKKQEKQFHCD